MATTMQCIFYKLTHTEMSWVLGMSHTKPKHEIFTAMCYPTTPQHGVRNQTKTS